MLSWLRNLLGLDEPPAPPAVLPLAVLNVSLSPDRSAVAVVEALDAGGNPLAEPWPAVSKADPGAARRAGNPTLDWARRFGETPTGDYEIAGIHAAPGRDGAGGVLLLTPLSGQAARADAQGRSLLFLFGADRPGLTDGSLLLPGEAFAQLVALLPADPATLRPRIRVVIRELPDAELEEKRTAVRARFAAWKGEDDDDGLLEEIAEDLFDRYTACYGWGQDDGGRDGEAGLADDGAAQALAGLGYAVLADGDAAPPAASPDQEAGRGRDDDAGAGWAPSGGDYDR